MHNYIPKMNRATWYKLQSIIISYETNKITYSERTNSILFSSPSPQNAASFIRSSNTSDTTGDKATQLNSPFMLRLLRNINAVDKVYCDLTDENKEFVRQYFWEGRTYLDCDIMRGKRYLSAKTLSRKCKDIVRAVGIELGEIE